MKDHTEYVADDEWEELAETAAAVRVPWAKKLRELIPDLTELRSWIRSSPDGHLQNTHGDIKAANVVVTPDGERVLVDWDETWGRAPDRELGRALMWWWFDNGFIDRNSVRNTMRTYNEFGGQAQLEGKPSFSSYVSVRTTFLRGRIKAALSDPESSATEIEHRLATFPRPKHFERVLAFVHGPAGSVRFKPPIAPGQNRNVVRRHIR